MPRIAISFLFALLSISHSILAQHFIPRGDIEYRYGTRLQRRGGYTCEPASPDVSEAAVITDACNENPQNNFNACFNTLAQYAQKSATDACSRYYTIYNDCLISHDWSETTCADARFGYVYCSNYTIQAYAYCGCYFAEPFQIFNCANVELSINRLGQQQLSQAPSSAILSSALLNGPIAPLSATLTDIPLSVPSGLPVFTPRQTPTSTEAEDSQWLCPFGVCDIPSLPPIPGAPDTDTSYPTDTPISTGVPISDDTDTSYPTPTDEISSASTTVPITNDITSPSSSFTPTAATVVSSTSIGIPISAVASTSAKQSTTTLLSTVPITRTSTITKCPPTITPCPQRYSSESIYTTSTVNTILSCDGGCDGPGPSRLGECVVRKRTRVLRRGEL